MRKGRVSMPLLAALVVILLVSTAGASTLPTGAAGGAKNPRTGRPIVTRKGPVLGPDTLAALVHSLGFADDVKAVAIAHRESGGDAGIVLDTRGMTPEELHAYWKRSAQPELSVGLWQINLLANAHLVPGDTLEEKVAALQSPSVNAAVALKLSQGGTNWAAWDG